MSQISVGYIYQSICGQLLSPTEEYKSISIENNPKKPSLARKSTWSQIRRTAALRTTTQAGMRIDPMHRQTENACIPISFSVEPLLNDTVRKALQREKQASQIISTGAGTQTDWSREHPENALGPIIHRLEEGSNDTVNINMQLEKQDEKSISAEAGIPTDSSDEQ
jgi:hypothetical protein